MNRKLTINNPKKLDVRKELRRNQTPQEVILWSKLRNNQTGYKWRRQVSLGRYIADFYCAEKKLVVEIDGSQHMQAKEYDTERDSYLNFLNLQVLRVWNNEINMNINGVMLMIENALNTSTSSAFQAPSPNLGEGENS